MNNPEPLSAIVEKTRRLVQPQMGENSEMVKWTLVVYAPTWAGLLPAGVAAKRVTWIPGLPQTQLNDDDSPASLLRQVEAGRWMWEQLLPKGTVIEPAQWRHFYSDLMPNIFEVSGMFLERAVSEKAEHTTLLSREQFPTTDSDTTATDPHESSPPSLSENERRVLVAMNRFDARRLVSVQQICIETTDAALRKGALSARTVGPIVAGFIKKNWAEPPDGENTSARLNAAGRRLAQNYGD